MVVQMYVDDPAVYIAVDEHRKVDVYAIDDVLNENLQWYCAGVPIEADAVHFRTVGLSRFPGDTEKYDEIMKALGHEDRPW
jgi:hypothetical protein